jgi:small subunit ribosomal protein S17
MSETPARPRRKTLVGPVVSDKMEKSIVVEVERLSAHPKYGKVLRRHTRVVAHDERNEARVGDVVEVASTRPLSRTKRWRLVRILREGRGRAVAQALGSRAAAGEASAEGRAPGGGTP